MSETRPRWCRMVATSVLALAATVPTFSASFYPLRPDDPRAVYVTKDRFAVRGDGVADDTAGLQAAIDHVQETTRRGIVFVPSGRYRLTKALLVWSGIRLIGYGGTRPVLVLAANTPGFREGAGAYLVHFASERPTSPDQPVRDANPGTFYSVISNIDIEIGDGNPAAVGVRAHFAQHCFLAHMDIHIDSGRAGVEEVGNFFQDLHFFGGKFGITMHKPSPSWPFALVDATFSGQRRAAIETEEGGLTLVRVHVSDTPTAVLVRPDRAEELWVEDSTFERISGPAIVISDEHNARTQINLEDITCRDVAVFATFRESGQELAGPGSIYRVRTFCHGLQLGESWTTPGIKTTFDAGVVETMPPPVSPVVAALPPMETWKNLRKLGAIGDGVADDTVALRAAIAQHRAIYLPSGRYRVTDTITLRPDTVLIGLNPITTQIVLADGTEAFRGVGSPKPLIEASAGGANIVTGIGLDTNGINPRAVALKWMSGATSLVDDVRLLGGHGTYGPDGRWLKIYNENHTADPDPNRKWDSEYWSLWVTDGGGGTFQNIWTPSPYAAAGLYVSNTATPGRVYALSSEHHVRNEIMLRRVAHWRFCALQTEEERGEGPHALPLDVQDCHDLTITNFFLYRVDTWVPFNAGIQVTQSHDLDFRGLHVYSPGKLSFDNTLIDQTHHVSVRSREIAWLHVSGASPATTPASSPGPEGASATQITRVAGGFTNIDGLVAGRSGEVYFVDQRWDRIFRWSDDRGLSLVTDAIRQPVALALDQAGNVLVVTRDGHVVALPPDGDADAIAVLDAQSFANPLAGTTVWLPTSRWRDAHDWLEVNLRREPLGFVSPDRSTWIPAPKAFVDLASPGRHWGTVDLARAYALAPARFGETFYVADEFGQKTWRFRVQADGSLADPELFAEEGEAGTVVDADGNVYVCAGHVFVYDPNGQLIDVIKVAERPNAVAFGGSERHVLFIAARTSLYTVRTQATGR